MLSKEKILRASTAYYDGTIYEGTKGSVEEVMDEYAKGMCIEFGDYLFANMSQLYYKCSETLFNQFLQEIKQDK